MTAYVSVTSHTNSEAETAEVGFPTVDKYKGQELLFLLDDGVTDINARRGVAMMLADAGTKDWLHAWTMSDKLTPELTQAVVALMSLEKSLPGVADVLTYFETSSSVNWGAAIRLYGHNAGSI